MTEYNKAVRDKIPEIIRKSGRSCNMKKLPDAEFLAEMEKKLAEELKEFQDSKSVEELADILEVAYRIADLRGVNSDMLDRIRQKKIQEKGGFEDNLFLMDTD